MLIKFIILLLLVFEKLYFVLQSNIVLRFESDLSIVVFDDDCCFVVAVVSFVVFVVIIIFGLLTGK